MNKYANGIGPTSWGVLCILLPYRTRFQLAGELHDLAYCLGLSEKDKELADYLFYCRCQLKCENNLQKLFAFLYYKAVKKFGKSYFNYH